MGLGVIESLKIILNYLIYEKKIFKYEFACILLKVEIINGYACGLFQNIFLLWIL